MPNTKAWTVLVWMAGDNDLEEYARGDLTELGLVAAEKHKGRSVARSHGVSIYVPRGGATVAYDRLDFARATRWDRFIEALTGDGQ